VAFSAFPPRLSVSAGEERIPNSSKLRILNQRQVERMRLFGILAICASALTAAPKPGPTFSKDVAPILQARCQTCHRPGEAAPMSLLSYQEARPWAAAIKEAVVLKKMPPWFADT